MPRDAYVGPVPSNAPAAKGRDRWIPWMFVLAFVVVSAVNATMIYFATSTFTGVAVEKPFERGVAYNKLLAAAEAEAKLGWTVEAGIRRLPTGVQMSIAIVTADGALDGASIAARLRRPLEPMPDVPVVVANAAPGRFVAELGDVKSGQWDLVMVVQRGSDKMHVTRRLMVP